MVFTENLSRAHLVAARLRADSSREVLHGAKGRGDGDQIELIVEQVFARYGPVFVLHDQLGLAAIRQ